MYLSGFDFIQKLCRALGLDEKQPVKRIVIDCDASSTVIVYIQRLLMDTDKLPELLAGETSPPVLVHVKDLSVSEKGKVSFTVEERRDR